MSIQAKKEITEYFTNIKGWTLEQVEQIGPQCGWDKSQMEQIYQKFKIKNQQNLGANYYLQQQQNLNQFNSFSQNINLLDTEQEEIQQALIASQNLQDNQPLIKRLRFDEYPLGIQNLGNTCYFNCLIQIIFYNPKLVKQILQYRRPESNQTGDTLQCSMEFMDEFQNAIANQILSVQKYFKPQNLYNASRKLEKNVVKNSVYNDDFRDVSEYFIVLMELLDQSINKNFIKQHNSVKIFQNEELDKQFIIKQNDLCQFQWPIGIKNQQIYNFLYKEVIGNQITIKELPENLVFSLERNVHVNKKIEKSEQAFYFAENLYLDFVLGDKNASSKVQKYIEKYEKTLRVYQKVTKQLEALEKVATYYESLPTFETFILNNLRFEQKKKINEQKNQFPMNQHILNKELQGSSKQLYQLAQIILHAGSIQSGHYYSYQYNFYLKRWFKYNDTEVAIVSEQDVLADSIKNGNIFIYLSQEQKNEVKEYQKQLIEIERFRNQKSLDMQLPQNIQFDLLKIIPEQIYQKVLQENQSFMDQYYKELRDSGY